MSIDQFREALAFRMSITDRAKNAARDDPSLNVTARLRLFAFQRLLDRVFARADFDHQEWVLKGATSLLCRFPEARVSKDVDLATRDCLEGAERKLRAAAGERSGDFLEYDLGIASPLTGRTDGRRFRVVTSCAGKKFAEFSIDLVTMDNFPDRLDRILPRRAIPFEVSERVEYLAWPLANAVADKVAATFDEYGDRTSTRYRDLVDLFLLRRHGTFDRSELRREIIQEMALRGIGVPASFEVPAPSAWARGWSKITSRDAPFLASVSFSEALTSVKEFLDPVLAEATGGRWDPSAGEWHR